MKVLVVIPTYNEAVNIPVTIERVTQVMPDATILVVDDNSPDGTADIVDALARDHKRLVLIRREGKRGLGASYRDGFAWGRQAGFEVMVEMDADLSHDPACIPDLIEAISDGAELTIGSRYVPGGSTPDWPWNRRSLSKWANKYAAFMLGLDVADSTAGFRAYRSELLDRTHIWDSRSEGYGFQIEMTYLASRAGAVIRERPIRFTDRTDGVSKMSGAIVREALIMVTKLGLKRMAGKLPGQATRQSTETAPDLLP